MALEPEKKEKLDKLERKLYSRNSPEIIDVGRSEFTPTPVSVPTTDWSDVKNTRFDELAARMSRVAEKKSSFVNKFFFISAGFFVIAAIVAFFVFWAGGNTVSSKNVDIQIVGPLEVPAGQEVSFDINIVNNNNIALKSASLLIEYPTGVRVGTDLTKDLPRERFTMEDIAPGESYRQNIKIYLFGEKNSIKEIKISLEYRVENSSALFYKEKTHEVPISSAPIIITPTYPKEVNSNQDITFNIEVASNSKDKLKNFLVNVEYPFGFVFKEASPKSSFGDHTWSFAELASGDKQKISIRGTIIGQNNEERVFRISAGTGSETDERQIAVPLSELTETILVKKPFIGLDVSVAGKSGDATVIGGSSVNTEIGLRNNLPSRFFNVQVETALSGGAFDGLSVSPGDSGFFQSSNNTIVWDSRSVSELRDLGPGDLVDLSFLLTPLTHEKIKSGSKPEVVITVKVSGERILESGSVEKISMTETRKMVLATDLLFSMGVVRSIGNLENTGPIPPKVNTPTTYTIVWRIQNSFNQVSNAEVKAVLPAYIKWTGEKSPSGELVNFNSTTNEITWQVGSILPNTGFSDAKKELYFQVEFLPSSSQIGDNPNLVGPATISGLDKVTGLKINKTIQAVTTNFSGDPTFRIGDERVVQ